jgi:hypothetical protein
MRLEEAGEELRRRQVDIRVGRILLLAGACAGGCAGVAHAVRVRVRLIGVRDAGAVVGCVRHAVTVAVRGGRSAVDGNGVRACAVEPDEEVDRVRDVAAAVAVDVAVLNGAAAASTSLGCSRTP